MNYILNIVKSKAFVLVTSIVLLVASCVVTSFAYSINNIYAIPDVSIDSTFLATLKAEDVVVLDVSPRSSPFSPYVLIDYDDLADLVFRSNQNGFNVSLEYRSNIDQYVAYADDSTLFGRRVFGCLGNVKGSVYVANASDSHDISGDIHDVLMEIMLDTSWINTRCDDFYNLLDYLCDKADSIEKEIKNIGVTNSRLNSIIRYLDVLADDLEADGSPLLTRLDTITLFIENIDLGIQSLNTALYDESSSPLLSRLNLIHVALGTPVQGRSVINLLMGMSTDVDRIRVAVNSLSSYDDTNVIAAVNSVETALSNLSFDVGDVTVAPADLTPVITSIDAVGLNIEDLNANFDTNIGSLLDKLDIVIEGTSESLENRINVTIDASNDAHNVFYITGEDGEEQSVTEFTGDLTKASGRLLSLLYRLVFADALSTVDGDLDGFEDFFTSQGEETATQDMNAPYEEENVWLAS